ncbi:hypothetical protein CEXT_251951 [Caerostris extrusa]|uniref:Uncharacterized protein n=1 Tax=Caerostris extrusa TaxID=172846 RepID=A0AAV4WAR6_CAEEX|nr:hypothetical protein CEXT_251951 [Caerostris extrusa]
MELWSLCHKAPNNQSEGCVRRCMAAEEMGCHCFEWLDFCLLICRRYFISLPPPNGKSDGGLPQSTGDEPCRDYRLLLGSLEFNCEKNLKESIIESN